VGDEDVGRIIAEIRAQRPNFILNNFVGASSYAFFEAYAALGREDAWFRPETCPLVSCNLTEAELPAIGQAGEGHLSVGPFFDTRSRLPNLQSSFGASAHSAILILSQLLATQTADAPLAFDGRLFDTPLGRMAIDATTRHSCLPVRIAEIRSGRFKVVEDHSELVAPDPYLSRYDPHTAFGRSSLRVVS
jgi:branched-chain amino acid transport system substrate-binding protein